MTTTDVYLGWLSILPLIWPIALAVAWVVFGMAIIIGHHVRLLFYSLIMRYEEGIELTWD